MQIRPLIQADTSFLIKILERLKFNSPNIELWSESDYENVDIGEILTDICNYIDDHDVKLLIDIKEENGLLFCNDFKLMHLM